MLPIEGQVIQYVVSDRCSRQCSFHPDNLKFSAETLHWYEQKRSMAWMITESERLGRKLSQASISRHRSHLDEAVDESAALDETGNVDHLKVLQMMIAAGARRAHTWRVGPKETMDAMNLYYKLTQGSAMESLFERLTAVAAGEAAEENEIEFDAGSLSPAELESVDADSS